jgi:hypothetical protein
MPLRFAKPVRAAAASGANSDDSAVRSSVDLNSRISLTTAGCRAAEIEPTDVLHKHKLASATVLHTTRTINKNKNKNKK